MSINALNTAFSNTQVAVSSQSGPESGRDPSAPDDPARTQTPVRDNSGLPPESRINGLSEADRNELRALAARDREVRAHEQAHLAAAGQYANGGIRYDFQRGPDGRLYAVGGEVSVDTSEVPGDPQATLRKAQTLQRAALAPSEPSSQDRAVAAEMARMALEARMQISSGDHEKAGSAVSPTPGREEDATVETGLETQIEGTCPACGGAHLGENHTAVSAYTKSKIKVQATFGTA